LEKMGKFHGFKILPNTHYPEYIKEKNRLETDNVMRRGRGV